MRRGGKPEWLLRRKAQVFLTPMAFDRLAVLEKATGMRRHVILDALIRSIEPKDSEKRVKTILAKDAEALSAWRTRA